MLTKMLIRPLLLLYLFGTHISLSLAQSDALNFTALTCNAIVTPTAIEDPAPLLSWIIKAEGFNKSQSAYHILVASSLDQLDPETADYWNTGKVISGQSANIPYHGKALQPLQQYFWSVRVYDESGQVSAWSAPQHFTMGLMQENQWGNAQWISLGKDTRSSTHRFRAYQTGRMTSPEMVEGQAAAYFRKTLVAHQNIISAQAYICALGYYELYLNGEKVGDHVLDPAPSNYDKQAYYVHHDITQQLKAGKNAIGIMLGNGFYGQDISWKGDRESEGNLSYGPPAVKLLIKLRYADGTAADFVTDGTWKEATGPVVFNNIYGGDTYDARYLLHGWDSPDYDDAEWGWAKVTHPAVAKISALQIPAIKRLKEFTPVNVFLSPRGTWIVDFGENMAGWIKLKAQEKEGTLIEIITTEALTKDGKDIFPGSTGGGANGMPQLFRYVCNGNDTAWWEPAFSYHGFRYAEIKGLSRRPDSTIIRSVLVATAIAEKGSFFCSDTLLNKMHAISKRTIQSNMHGIPEDCPHREKCGWLGDAHAFCEYALYNYELENFYAKYMEDIRTQMRPAKGQHTDSIFQVPTMIAPGKRTSTLAKLDWGIATIYLPWYNYLHYGNDAMVKEYYAAMKNLTAYYLTFKDDNGIIQNGMGDWCPPDWDRINNPTAMECDPVISANAYFYDILGIMEKFALMNNDVAFAQTMQQEKLALYTAFNRAFLVALPSTAWTWYGSQTATVMALQFGMVPDASLASVLAGLEYHIKVVKGGHHATGIHGNRYIYTTLSNHGKADLAYTILTTPDFPSQTYVMNYGFTTWPERQFNWDKMPALTNSLNHPMHSGFAAYFFETLGGIKSSTHATGYREFKVNPIVPEKITHATVTIPTRFGMISNAWTKNGRQFSMTINIPFNTMAHVILSQKEIATLSVNGMPYKAFQQQYNTSILDGALLLGSGQYTLMYEKDTY